MSEADMTPENTAPEQPAEAAPHQPQVHRILGLVDGEWQELVSFDYALNHEGRAVYPTPAEKIVSEIMRMRQRRERSAMIYGVMVDLTLPAYRAAVG